MSNQMISEKQGKWYDFAQRISEEGIVLLRNDNGVLPFGNEKIAVFGQAQFSDAKICKDYCIIEGLKKSGLNISESVYKMYKDWLDAQGKRITYRGNMAIIASDPEMPITVEDAKKARADGAQKALIVIKRQSGENSDMAMREGDYYLAPDEKAMIENVCKAFDKVVLVLEIGLNIDLGFLDENKIDGILYVNYIADMSAVAISRILKGEANPSGKLPFTMARHHSDYPSDGHFGQHGGGLIQDYYEDIFVGYRWFDTFDKKDAVVFPFGYGLSYTDFEVNDVKFETGSEIKVQATVKNIGTEYSGREVLQLYFSAPSYKDGAKLGKPAKELCDFAKTHMLAPGESETLTLTVKPENMASYDDTGVTGYKSSWVLEKGTYTLLVGNSSSKLVKAGEYEQKETECIRKCPPITTTLPERILADGTYEKLPEPADASSRPIAVATDRKITASVNRCNRTDAEITDSLSVLKKGEGADYLLMPGAGGSHYIRFLNGEKNVDISDILSVSVDGTELSNLKFTDNGYEFTLPLARCKLSVAAKVDAPEITAIEIEKIDTKVVVRPEGENIIQAQNYYEGSFCINVENYDATETDEGGSCVTNFVASGMNVIYKLEVEQEGNYDISFKYAYIGERKSLNNTMTVAVSNIVHPLPGIMLDKTYNEGEKRVFTTSSCSNISLPKGTIYLKMVAEVIPFPDIAQIKLVKSEKSVTLFDEEEIAEKKSWAGYGEIPVVEPDDGKREGILLKDVANDPSMLKPFLEQLSNRELATLASGTSLNKTKHGNVGCTHPLLLRGIPACQTDDGPMGLILEQINPTHYPASVILTASFDKELYEQYGETVGEECNFYGIDYWLAPSINIFRDPCGGRNFSYSSEDPYLAGIFGAYQILGLQRYGVASVLKHYCANSTEYERLKSNSRVSERALREIYMKGFEIAVKLADPWAIMSSYNHVNDVKACESYELITEIPRNEWNWDGAFMTDWWNDSRHVDELKAGHDIKMATGDIDGVTAALDSGELSREQVYLCAGRVIRMLLKLKSVKEFLEKE